MKQTWHNRNENPYGPAPACLAVLRHFHGRDLAMYTEGHYSSQLRPAIARLVRLPERQVIISYGLEELLRSVYNQQGPGGVILTHEHHFLYYTSYARFRGIPLRTFRLQEHGTRFAFDIDDCLRQYRACKPRVLILTTPNNPTGQALALKDLQRILKVVSRNTLVLIDEAYREFSPSYSDAAVRRLLRRYPQVAFLRTFSKFYALAGLRVGYALVGLRALQLMGNQPWYLGFNRLAEDIALAALRSKPFYARTTRRIARDRDWLTKRINALPGCTAFISKANFLALRISPPARQTRVLAALQREPSVLVTPFPGGLLRVTIGTTAEVRRFFERLASLLGASAEKRGKFSASR